MPTCTTKMNNKCIPWTSKAATCYNKLSLIFQTRCSFGLTVKTNTTNNMMPLLYTFSGYILADNEPQTVDSVFIRNFANFAIMFIFPFLGQVESFNLNICCYVWSSVGINRLAIMQHIFSTVECVLVTTDVHFIEQFKKFTWKFILLAIGWARKKG